MKTAPVFFLALLSVFSSHAQNLVPNPGIEFLTACGYYETDNWYSPNSETTDFIGVCNAQVPVNYYGVQQPFDGSSYGGIRTYSSAEEWPMLAQYREYLAVQLLQPLKSGYKYAVRFKYSVADNADYTSDRLGLYLSRDFIAGTHVLPFTPQIENPEGNFLTDSVHWNTISGDYIAKGGEQYIVIGNFYPDNQTNVIHYNPNPDIHLKHFTYFFIDHVEVIKDPDYIPADPYLIIPNLVTANNDHINDSFMISTNLEYTSFEVSIYNCWGARVFQSTSQAFEWTGDTEGVYYYQITANKTLTYKGWVQVMH